MHAVKLRRQIDRNLPAVVVERTRHEATSAVRLSVHGLADQTKGVKEVAVEERFQLWRISTLWVAAFTTLLVIAMVGDGTFEADFWGYVVVMSALVVRMMDGYIGIMVFRFIAAKHEENEQSITVFFGVTAMVINFFGSIASTVLVETGIIAD